ncbi:hypothetical protein BHE90_012990 [Fusarium euwallaceae]|uniref:Uncharacterized protein n=1 Tax=Fusarium euwallaceae TaxID=1147111 RepID=A0A430LA28_9HYPO|nr:hypothetical protein BHE90_012990 [Fusarium euwallaceae]
MSLWPDTSMHPTPCLTLHNKRNDDNNQIVADSDMLTSTIDTITPFRAPGDSLDIEYSENVAAFQRIQTLRKRLQAKRRQVLTGGSPWDLPPPTIQKPDILRMIHDHYQACAKALGGSSIQAFPTWPSHLPRPKGFLSRNWMRKTFGDRLTKPFSSPRKNRPSPLIS